MNCRKTVFSILNNLSKTASALVSLLQSQTPLPVSPLQKLLEIAPAKAFQYLLSRLSALLQAFKGIWQSKSKEYIYSPQMMKKP
jgi:hypothetical protein